MPAGSRQTLIARLAVQKKMNERRPKYTQVEERGEGAHYVTVARRCVGTLESSSHPLSVQGSLALQFKIDPYGSDSVRCTRDARRFRFSIGHTLPLLRA